MRPSADGCAKLEVRANAGKERGWSDVLDEKAEREAGHAVVTEVAITLVTALLDSDEGVKLLDGSDLMVDLALMLSDLDPVNSVHLSTAAVAGTSAKYFALIGVLLSAPAGVELLEQHRVLSRLYAACGRIDRDDVLILLLQNTDFRHKGHSRTLLEMIVSHPEPNVRCSALDHIKKLICESQFARRDPWVVKTVVTQLYDPDPTVAKSALDALMEACEDTEALKSVINLEPTLLHLGGLTSELILQFLGVRQGFDYLKRCGFVEQELELWHTEKNLAYVGQVEISLSEALQLFKQPDARESDPGIRLVSKTSSAGSGDRPRARLPLHFYGELCRTKEGVELLKRTGHIGPMTTHIRRIAANRELLPTTSEGLEYVKAELWALGHVGTCALGLSLLPADLVDAVVFLAEHAEVVSIRGVAIYVLGLLGKTVPGSQRLLMLGWKTFCESGSRYQSVSVAVPVDPAGFFSIQKLPARASGEVHLIAGCEGQMSASNSIAVHLEKGKLSIHDQIISKVEAAVRMPAVIPSDDASPTDSPYFPAVRDAVVTCVVNMSTDIMISKIRPLINQLRAKHQLMIDTLEMFFAVRTAVDAQLFTLATRRLMYTMFGDWVFWARELPGFVGDVGAAVASITAPKNGKVGKGRAADEASVGNIHSGLGPSTNVHTADGFSCTLEKVPSPRPPRPTSRPVRRPSSNGKGELQANDLETSVKYDPAPSDPLDTTVGHTENSTNMSPVVIEKITETHSSLALKLANFATEDDLFLSTWEQYPEYEAELLEDLQEAERLTRLEASVNLVSGLESDSQSVSTV